ncbi:MAG TPA: hypothetical protein VGP82_06310 [Ktedonobacterales bacterium]|nr:hypothetical protein [Ktedonobacterales bacterium]
MKDTLAQLGLAAGAAGWKAGHAAVQSGMLILDGLDDEAQTERLETYAAAPARAYMRQIVEAQGLTPAEGARLFGVYMYAFSRGALDQALDGGALLR